MITESSLIQEGRAVKSISAPVNNLETSNILTKSNERPGVVRKLILAMSPRQSPENSPKESRPIPEKDSPKENKGLASRNSRNSHSYSETSSILELVSRESPQKSRGSPRLERSTEKSNICSLINSKILEEDNHKKKDFLPTGLVEAIKSESIPIILQYCNDPGININCALIYATILGNLEIVRLLMERPGFYSLKEEQYKLEDNSELQRSNSLHFGSRSSILRVASRYSHKKIVEYLCSIGPKLRANELIGAIEEALNNLDLIMVEYCVNQFMGCWTTIDDLTQKISMLRPQFVDL
jgi:hypothetical protein